MEEHHRILSLNIGVSLSKAGEKRYETHEPVSCEMPRLRHHATSVHLGSPITRVRSGSRFLPAKRQFSLTLLLVRGSAPGDNPDCNRCSLDKNKGLIVLEIGPHNGVGL